MSVVLKKSLLFFLGVLFFQWIQAKDPKKDSLVLSVSTGVTSASRDFLPFYLTQNRWGLINEEPSLFSEILASYHYEITKNWSIQSGVHARNSTVGSYYISSSFRNFKFSLGAKAQKTGGLATNLAINQFGLSPNARPLPSFTFETDGYLPIAKTKDYVWIKGGMSKGQFEKNRYMKNALLHSKNLYIKLKLEEFIGFNISSGFVHFAQYGGTSPFGVGQPSTPKDFWKAFTGRELISEYDSLSTEKNGRGNHLGMTEIIIEKSLKNHQLSLDYQTPYERIKDLHYFNFHDFILALNWKLPVTTKWLEEVHLEYSQTMWQNGPGLPQSSSIYPTKESNYGYEFGGRANYNNHWLYRSGFTYHHQTMGNPLFMTYQFTQNFMPLYPAYEVSITNNRIKSFHIAMTGFLSSKIQYRSQFTSVVNFGSYTGLFDGLNSWAGITNDLDYDYVFRGGKWQYYSLLELKYQQPITKYPFDLSLMMARDFGDFYSNWGLEISIVYNIQNK
ncbi:MAG: hypothetical protein HQ474_03120 [Flammeovirgaceae bacterium]|jgi:hypothetical protein|nr:hypothetical protein [Flammeovirgaceae bacterium]|tara:strand:+ start:13862 stop:15370 length:1509 start_codon:yes stop_codon:yes gene_type:complete